MMSTTALSFLRRRANANLRSLSSVKHVVMVRFKPDTRESEINEIHESILVLPLQIPEIQTYELGVDLLLEAGQKHPAGPNRSLCWSATFASVKDYQTYDTSKAHQKFLGKLLPVMEPGSRAAIQYEMTTSSPKN